MDIQKRLRCAAMGSYRPLAFRSLLLGLLAAFSLGAGATPTTYAQASAWTQWAPSYFEPGDHKSDFRDAGSSVGAVSAANARADVATSRNFATATAGLGYVKAGAFGSEVNPFSVSGGATARFSDDLRLSAAGIDGQMGSITVAFYYDYLWDVSGYPDNGGYSNASMTITAKVGNQIGQLRDYEMDGYRYERTTSLDDAGGNRALDNGPGHWMFVNYDYRWGSVFGIGMEMQINASTSSPDSRGIFSYAIDGTHSGYWGGIVAASAEGVGVDTYLLESASGVDYFRSFAPSAAVPEPGSLGLTVGALIALLLARGARQRRRASV